MSVSAPAARPASPTTLPPKASRRLVAAAALACLTVALLQTLVIAVLPAFPALLNATPGGVSWLVTANLLIGAIATPIAATLADRHGKRTVILVALALVVVGSIVAPWGGLATLIVGRALQGIGSVVIPLLMAAMRDHLAPGSVAKAVAIISAVMGVGGGVGVPLGGAVDAAWGWPALFWTSAILAALSAAAIWFALPHASAGAQGRFDVLGSVLLSLALLGLLLTISQGQTWGWGSALTIGSGTVGVLALAAWIATELRVSVPMLDIRAAFGGSVALVQFAALFTGFVLFTNLIVTTVELQSRTENGGFGWTASQAGLAMIPQAVAMLAVAPLVSRLVARWGATGTLVFGAAVSVFALAARVFFTPAAAWVIVWTTVIAVGVTIVYSTIPLVVMSHVPPTETAQANGANSVLRTVGSATASTVVAAVVAALAVAGSGGTVTTGAGAKAAYLVALGAAVVALVLGLIAWSSARRRA